MNIKKQDIKPSVSVLIIGDNIKEKSRNIQTCDYPEIIEIIEVRDINDSVNKARGEIILFTDTKTSMDLAAVSNIVQPFADERVACVVGQQTNIDGNSIFWRYENFVKSLESRVGCVSGATESIFAIRKTDMPIVAENVINKPFNIAMKITENGRDVIFQPSAKAYEEKTIGTNFSKHVQDARGYWQAFKLFPKLLLPRKGSFVYVSHRVMKWFVWLNMLTSLVTSGFLARSSVFMGVLFGCQLFGYASIFALGKMSKISRIIGIGYYFIILNISYFVGLFSKRKKVT